MAKVTTKKSSKRTEFKDEYPSCEYVLKELTKLCKQQGLSLSGKAIIGIMAFRKLTLASVKKENKKAFKLGLIEAINKL